MTRDILRPALFSAGLLFLILIVVFSCSKDQSGEIAKQEGSSSEPVATSLSPEKADQLLVDLLEIQTQIQQAPLKIELRHKYIEKGFEPHSSVFRAAGVGLLPPNASSPLIARQSAERAAFLDACRWIAYGQAWQKDIKTPDFGKLSGRLANARVIHKKDTPDGAVQLLVESVGKR